MNNKNSFLGFTGLCLAVSIIVLIIHIYFYYYPVFERLGWYSNISNQVLIHMLKAGFFYKPYSSKGLALIFLLLSIFGSAGRKTPEISLVRSSIIFLEGVVL